jgi:hypothetical protein
MYLENLSGNFNWIDRRDIVDMSRDELQGYLERRGFAVYDDESTSLLRETALEDFDNERM